MAQLTQKERVLKMLKDAGRKGIRSDEFYRAFMGRGVARIHDLKAEGYPITSEREGKYTRYKLAAAASPSPGISGNRAEGDTSSTDSTPEAVPSAHSLFSEEPRPSVPSAYDPWSEAA